MKKSLYFAALLSAVLFTACEGQFAKKYDVDVTISAPVALSELSDLKVVALSETGAETESVLTDNVASFELASGTYTFRATASNDNFNFNASEQKAISEDAALELTLTPSAKQASGIIFKEIYSTGVMSYYFMDAFYELINNSDTVQYLDGIIMGIVVNGYGDASPWIDADGKLPDFYPMTNHTVYFPGNGTDYPLQPGESVICAAKAIDHHSRELTEEDVQSPVNLSNADWDIFIPTSATDIDNPDVPNMLVAYSTFGFEFMPATSGQSLILAKLPEGQSVADFAADENNIKKYEGAWMSNFCIPAEYVIDAVDIIYFNEDKLINKTILDKDDAGYTYVSGSDNEWTDPMYSGKSIRRKCQLVTPTRVYYQDTNNSSNDWIAGGQVPTPGINPIVAD